MKVVLFTHSFTSCWNHGNAHFLRGIARELLARGHQVTVFEPRDGWSLTHALSENGAGPLEEAAALVPGVRLERYADASPDLDRALDRCDLVLVHEWTDPEIVAAIGRRRAAGHPFTLLFHDTHHRAVTAPDEIDAFDLDAYDGVLAFGDALRDVYDRRGWGRRAITWHEAADTALFRPLHARKICDLVWIGNWGDGERTAELARYLLGPAARLGLTTHVHGVRYPREALARLALSGIAYRGWLPNHRVPEAFAAARMTVHVPRAPYARQLPGIPTIRMFEALACAVPLVSAPWSDTEGLFPADTYLRAANEEDMTAALRALRAEPDLAAEIAGNGLAAIRRSHTCRHRVVELESICQALDGGPADGPAHGPAHGMAARTSAFEVSP